MRFAYPPYALGAVVGVPGTQVARAASTDRLPSESRMVVPAWDADLRSTRERSGRRPLGPAPLIRVLLCWALVFLAGPAAPAALDLGSTGDHVRVVLDTSKSMCGAACGWQDPPNDPGRLAVLSTVLLHDLLKPDPHKAENPDSFAVIPFAYGKWTGAEPPAATGEPRRARGMAARAEFIESLGPARLPFDAMNTYYAPGIAQALADLPPLTAKDSAAMTRTIVLVTDGLSVNPEADRAFIEERLLPALAARQTRLYVILFGPDANQQGEAFFAAIKAADAANVRAGRYPQHVFPEYFLVRTGAELPATMIRLFSEGFGYLNLPEDRKERVGKAPVALDLHRNLGPTEAAVVALRVDPAGQAGPVPPRLVLDPPPGGSVNPQHRLTAREPGGAYALRWELKPSPGEYRAQVEPGDEAALFVLRPTNLTVALREHRPPPGTAAAADALPSCFAPGALVTMADRPCRLDFLVGSAAGTAGMPPKLALRYWIKQPQPGGRDAWNINDADGSGIADTHTWDDAQAGGRRYYSQTQFTRNQLPGGADDPYRAQVQARVDLANRTVAARGADDPFEVLVYPRLGLSPQPPVVKLKDAETGAIGRQRQACTTFTLTEDFGTRLESARAGRTAAGAAAFNVRAYLAVDPTDRAGAARALRDARFTLDGEPIGLQSDASGAASGSASRSAPGSPSASAGRPGPDAGWSQGRARPLADLVERDGQGGHHQLCVTLGPYADGDPLRPPALQLRFILDHPPYDHFDVVRGLRAEVLVARAPGLDWWGLLPFALLLLGLFAALLFLRPRHGLPRDLGYGLASTADPGQFTPRALPPPHLLRRLFSRRAGRPVTDPRGAPLGWIRPEAEALYGLRPARGVQVSDEAGTPLTADGSGALLLEVHRPYRVDCDDDAWWLRVQYL